MSTGESFNISCDTCARRDSEHCGDCVVTFICGREPGDAVIIDVEELRAIRMLSDAGLVPELRHAGI
jgi:hypothetical protein